MAIRVCYYPITVYILLHTWSKPSGTPTLDAPFGPKLQNPPRPARAAPRNRRRSCLGAVRLGHVWEPPGFEYSARNVPHGKFRGALWGGKTSENLTLLTPARLPARRDTRCRVAG